MRFIRLFDLTTDFLQSGTQYHWEGRCGSALGRTAVLYEAIVSRGIIRAVRAAAREGFDAFVGNRIAVAAA